MVRLNIIAAGEAVERLDKMRKEAQRAQEEAQFRQIQLQSQIPVGMKLEGNQLVPYKNASGQVDITLDPRFQVQKALAEQESALKSQDIGAQERARALARAPLELIQRNQALNEAFQESQDRVLQAFRKPEREFTPSQRQEAINDLKIQHDRLMREFTALQGIGARPPQINQELLNVAGPQIRQGQQPAESPLAAVDQALRNLAPQPDLVAGLQQRIAGTTNPGERAELERALIDAQQAQGLPPREQATAFGLAAKSIEDPATRAQFEEKALSPEEQRRRALEARQTQLALPVGFAFDLAQTLQNAGFKTDTDPEALKGGVPLTGLDFKEEPANAAKLLSTIEQFAARNDLSVEDAMTALGASAKGSIANAITKIGGSIEGDTLLLPGNKFTGTKDVLLVTGGGTKESARATAQVVRALGELAGAAFDTEIKRVDVEQISTGGRARGKPTGQLLLSLPIR